MENAEQTRVVFNTESKSMASHAYEANEFFSNGIPTNVVVSGFGMKRGFVGKDNQFEIDASKAGELWPHFAFWNFSKITVIKHTFH